MANDTKVEEKHGGMNGDGKVRIGFGEKDETRKIKEEMRQVHTELKRLKEKK